MDGEDVLRLPVTGQGQGHGHGQEEAEGESRIPNPESRIPNPESRIPNPPRPYSSPASFAAVAALRIPSTSFTFVSISSAICGFSWRKAFAFSRP
jgi:hypothetical protein